MYEFEVVFTAARKGFKEEPRRGTIYVVEPNVRTVARNVNTAFDYVKMHSISNMGPIQRSDDFHYHGL